MGTPKQSNEETVGHLVALARSRNARDLESAGSRGLWYDEDAATRAVKFFSLLCHSKGEWAGKPFILEPWQEHDIIRPLFGWKRADGTRRFRTAYVSVARKNGKSPLAAGIALYLLIADHEPGAEVYSAATKKDQARIVFRYAYEMVRQSPRLKKYVKLFRDSIVVLRSGSYFQPLSADANTLDGLSTHGAVIDELHAHKTRRVRDVMRTSTSARRQPLEFDITTAGFDRKTICWEVHDLAVKMLEGSRADDSLFAYIATIDKEDDWRDEKCWLKANPNLGISKKVEYMQTEFAAAKDTPAYQNTFRRLDLNQWTEQSSRAIDMAEWHACTGKVDAEALQGSSCFAALDLSSVSDITALDLEFPVEESGENVYKGLSFFWMPEASFHRRVASGDIPAEMPSWVESGLIELTPGNVTDYDFIIRKIKELAQRYQIVEIAYDKWNAASTATKLEAEGFKMVDFRQGYASYNEPTKKYLGLILNRRLHHGNNPVQTWMAGNLAVRQDAAGNLKPDKEKSTEKIDGQVVKIMAIGRASLYCEVEPSITVI